MNVIFRYFQFAKWLNKQTRTVSMRRNRQRVYFNKTFHSRHNLLAFEHIDELVDKGEMIKRGNSTTVSKVNLSGQWVVIKRYNTNSILAGIKQLFCVSKAYNSWFVGHWMRHNGIATPNPLAVVELQLGLLWKRSYLVAEYLPFCPLEAFLQDEKYRDLHISKMVERMRALFAALRHARVSHGDCKISNLPCLQDDICLVDLDHASMHAFGLLLWWRLRRDKRRFIRNFEQDPEIKKRCMEALQ